MRGKGWKCLNCGGVFDRLLDIGSGTWWDPPSYVCPFCRSDDVTDLWFKCDSCEKEFEVEDMQTDEYCKPCFKAAEDEFLDYMRENKPMSDKAKEIILTYWREL